MLCPTVTSLTTSLTCVVVMCLFGKPLSKALLSPKAGRDQKSLWVEVGCEAGPGELPPPSLTEELRGHGDTPLPVPASAAHLHHRPFPSALLALAVILQWLGSPHNCCDLTSALYCNRADPKHTGQRWASFEPRSSGSAWAAERERPIPQNKRGWGSSRSICLVNRALGSVPPLGNLECLSPVISVLGRLVQGHLCLLST